MKKILRKPVPTARGLQGLPEREISMTITKKKKGTELFLYPEGRLDTTASPIFEKELKENIEGITSLIIDFAGLKYISSAGLRVLLYAQKVMKRQGSMVVCNVNDEVAEILEVTGFADILTIKR